jgi:hypothetical protein
MRARFASAVNEHALTGELVVSPVSLALLKRRGRSPHASKATQGVAESSIVMIGWGCGGPMLLVPDRRDADNNPKEFPHA